MTTKDNNKRLPEASNRAIYKAPELRHFGQVGALTQNGTNNGTEFFMMMQVVTMMRN